VYILDIVSLPFAPEFRQILSNRQKSLKNEGFKSQNHGVSYLEKGFSPIKCMVKFWINFKCHLPM
jgi:hypothetical protein